MIDILWGYSKDICMISDVVWGKKSQKKDNDIYVQPLNAKAIIQIRDERLLSYPISVLIRLQQLGIITSHHLPPRWCSRNHTRCTRTPARDAPPPSGGRGTCGPVSPRSPPWGEHTGAEILAEMIHN